VPGDALRHKPNPNPSPSPGINRKKRVIVDRQVFIPRLDKSPELLFCVATLIVHVLPEHSGYKMFRRIAREKFFFP
jgi:hypothetical protein